MIRVSPDGQGFVDETTGEPFVPVGVNYAATAGPMPGTGLRGLPLFGTDRYTAADGLAEGVRMLDRISELGLNTVRIWLEPHDFFPVGTNLDPVAADKLDRLLAAGAARGVRFVMGMHLATLATGLRFHQDLFQPPHQERQLAQLDSLARRWGRRPEIFSWSIIGEGTLPWYTAWMAQQWPVWLEYWYNGDLAALKKAWGASAFSRHYDIRSFADAPIPPRNVGLDLPLPEFSRRLGAGTLPEDLWAGSTWRYDWRLFMEELGSARVRQEVQALRQAGAQQMITVGNNCWLHPCLPAGWMGAGYHPAFYLDCVDYLCQHDYAFFQCLPGFIGDPLDSPAALEYWLGSMEVMGRFYGSLGKPVMLEEWGWYGGCASAGVDCRLPFRSEEDQARFCEQMLKRTQSWFAGWLNWTWRDLPDDVDITNGSGLFAADGNRLKPWGKKFADWAGRLKRRPPRRLPGKQTVDVPMKAVMTSDRAVDEFFRETIRLSAKAGPLDFREVHECKPITNIQTNR